MTTKPEDRVERIVSDLLRGRRLSLRGGDAEDRSAIIAAARLAAAQQGVQRMRPAFRKQLAQELEQAPERGWLTRRSALVAGLGIAAGAAAGGLIGRSLTPSHAGRAGRPIEPANARWIDVAAFSDLVEGQAKLVSAGGVSGYLFRNGSTVTAVSSMCSDMPCELRWNAGTGLLDCPCHPASFTPAGQPVTYSYSLSALNTLHVRVTSTGRVEVMGTA